MTDIWDEKPARHAGIQKSRLFIEWYHGADMDAWLEKLKAEVDRLNKEGLEHHAIAVEYYEKLEAVRTLVDRKNEVTIWDYQTTLDEIRTLLEVETCGLISGRDYVMLCIKDFEATKRKLEAVKKYCSGVLEETKDFPNWMVIVRKLMRDILKIMEEKQ